MIIIDLMELIVNFTMFALGCLMLGFTGIIATILWFTFKDVPR